MNKVVEALMANGKKPCPKKKPPKKKVKKPIKHNGPKKYA